MGSRFDRHIRPARAALAGVASILEFGATDFDGLLERPIPILSMIGDSHAAAIGEGCLKPGVAKATMGTGSSILMNLGAKAHEPEHGLVSTLCFAMDERVDYALEGIVISTGSTPAFFKEKLNLFDDFAKAEQAFTEYDRRRVRNPGVLGHRLPVLEVSGRCAGGGPQLLDFVAARGARGV